MDKILGLDLGTNSIGWALRNPVLLDNQIEKVGVITFNKGVGSGKTGEYSYAAERTKKRSIRRLYQSRKYRLWATLEYLIVEGYCPLTIENLNKWRKYNKEEALKNNNSGRIYPVDDLAFDQWIKLDFDGDGKPDYSSPYQLRKELADKPFDFDLNLIANKYKFGRAMYHIAQRRGFKSSRKGSNDLKVKETDIEEVVDLKYSEKKRNKTISNLYEKYPEAKTIGWLYALLEKDNIRIRENITQYAIRENYKDEIKYIFHIHKLGFEHTLYKKLVETGINKNDGSIFYKRPLRSQKGLIGKCTLEPNKYRAPISHPKFELFRAWSFINNIKFKLLNDKSAFWQPLPLSLKTEILNSLFFRKSKSYFPFSDIVDFTFKKGLNWQFNFSLKTTVTGCPVSARLKDIFGESYLQIQIPKGNIQNSEKSYYDIEDIWHVLFTFEDQELITEFAEIKLSLTPEKTKQFILAWNTLPIGYGMLSLNAINKINKLLEKGLIYTEAVLLANIPKIIGHDTWKRNEYFLLENISAIINENRKTKNILTIVNYLIAKYKNLEHKFGYKDNSYELSEADKKEVLEEIEEAYGKTKFNQLSEIEKQKIINAVKFCYQSYFKSTGFKRKDINGERYFEINFENQHFLKSDSGFYRLPKLIDTLGEFLLLNFNTTQANLKYIYHPSDISIYSPAKTEQDGMIKLGSPITGSFKNPMALRTLHELRRFINYMIETNQIDNDTRIVVEVARELNDSNKRWAIETWQKQREAENQEFEQAVRLILNKPSGSKINEIDTDKVRLFYEQNHEQLLPALVEEERSKIGDKKKLREKDEAVRWNGLGKKLIDKYRLWIEQGYQCFYTGKYITLSDLFKDNVIDIEHTIPRSISFDNSLANQTVCFHDYNRTIKKKQIPTALNNYEKDYSGYTAIVPRLNIWKEKVERIKQQVNFWKTKSQKATEKSWKDDAIRQRHLWQMELNYWQNKLERFTMTEITTGFKNSQKVDTQLISKYALHYLKTYFEKVDVQKGSITAEFRKIYGLQSSDEKKDRSKYSHHAKDAAVLTLIPIASKRDEILKTYYEYKEQFKTFTTEPYRGFKREFVWNIDEHTLINNIQNDQTLTPAKRKIRKRGKEINIPGTHKPMWATGDCIRGQLHQETFYGAIFPAKRDNLGNLLKNEEGKLIPENKLRFVIRVPFQFKKDNNTPGFKSLDEIQKQIVDFGLKSQIEQQVINAGGLKEAFEKGIYLLDKKGNPHGNKIRHIRIWANLSEPLKIKKQTNISKAEHKQHYYVGNATNSYFAIYKGENKKDFDFRNLFETAQFKSLKEINKTEDLFEKVIYINKNKKVIELRIQYILSTGIKVIFLQKDQGIEDIKSLPQTSLLKQLYIYTNFEKDGRLNFKFHMEARNKIEEKYIESEIDFINIKPTLRFSYSKYEFLVENYDFKISPDGVINWS